MSEEIFSEIEEDLYKERMKKLWLQYGKFIIAGSVFIILFGLLDMKLRAII